LPITMAPTLSIWLATGLAVALAGLWLFLRWGTRWGSTTRERALELPGDRYLEGGPPARAVLTRAIWIRADPRTVWPWLAQLGRGAGWYSFDRLDNGDRLSARHVVSWIPEPRLGDASPIGYLRRIEPGRALAWWASGVRFAGATTRLVVEMRLTAEDGGTRLLIRMSADAAGPTARLALLAFRFIDSIMAIRQLQGIRERVERCGARKIDPEIPETGARDQYQLYEAIYASGLSAGVRGKEFASRWRQSAIEDGILQEEG